MIFAQTRFGYPKRNGPIIRCCRWKTKKTNHALRAFAGCQVALVYGLYEASRFLRHSTIKVTQDHYMHLLGDGPTLTYLRDHCVARWATSEQPAPILSIVPQSV
jgi:hypothetical protein